VRCHVASVVSLDIRLFVTVPEVPRTAIEPVLTPIEREHLDRRETHTVSTTVPTQPATKRPPIPSVEDIFGDTEPLR
jgi:hypothetical protein